MYKKSFLQPIFFGLIALIFASCDKGFNEFGTNIVGDDHFGFELDSLSTVKVYNQKLGAIATNNLPINALGFYTNPAFGTTQANFVTQLELSSTNPVFNNTVDTLYVDLPTIDSVIVDIPYFKKLKSTATNGDKTYVLDSIYGETPFVALGPTTSKFKLSLYQSNFFLRDLDPNQTLTEQQLFYNDENNVIDNNKIPVLLNDKVDADEHENNQFYFDKNEHKLTTYKDNIITNPPIYTRSAPSMRLHLRTDVFYSKILNAPSGQLASQAIFKNYFRGLYFKVENGNPGNMALLNFKGGKISIYYKEDKITFNNPHTTANEYKLERVSKTFALNLSGNTVSLLENSNENSDYLTAANNTTQEASKIYLKGGQGSMAIIDLFGSTDTKGYVLNPSYNANIPLSATNPKYTLTIGPNGISDEIDDIKFNGWLINEANLTFYVDKTVGNALSENVKAIEPNRIYLYDLTNKRPLLDYIFDQTTDGVNPKRNKAIFGGILLNENESVTKQIRNLDGVISNKGNKYKIRLTNYVRNLVTKDSTNVRLGLSVSESIANTDLSKLRTPNTNFTSVPTMSVMSPLGTILYGSNIPMAHTQEYKKRLKLEIYYTKPN